MENTIIDDISKKATDVRKKWSETVDTVVRDKPVFVSRTHDNIVMINVETMKLAFSWVKYSIELTKEKDGSYTGTLCELDLVENADSKNGCIETLVNAIKEYAIDYYAEFSLWSTAPNTKKHLPYVLKALYSSDDEIREAMICHDGKI